MALTTKYGKEGIGRYSVHPPGASGLKPKHRRRNAKALQALAEGKRSAATRHLRKMQKPKRKPNGSQAPATFAAPPKYVKGMGADFYLTREWRSLRWRVLVASDGRCQMCGRGKVNGILIHVDHVISRHNRPDMELEFSNLQVLCEDCNIGKGKHNYRCE
jgi:5-methylcytosine-specific restriction endonuclease McrA